MRQPRAAAGRAAPAAATDSGRHGKREAAWQGGWRRGGEEATGICQTRVDDKENQSFGRTLRCAALYATEWDALATRRRDRRRHGYGPPHAAANGSEDNDGDTGPTVPRWPNAGVRSMLHSASWNEARIIRLEILLTAQPGL